MNKVLPYDLRSIRGHFRESPIIIGSTLAIVYCLAFYFMDTNYHNQC